MIISPQNVARKTRIGQPQFLLSRILPPQHITPATDATWLTTQYRTTCIPRTQADATRRASGPRSALRTGRSRAQCCPPGREQAPQGGKRYVATGKRVSPCACRPARSAARCHKAADRKYRPRTSTFYGGQMDEQIGHEGGQESEGRPRFLLTGKRQTAQARR